MAASVWLLLVVIIIGLALGSRAVAQVDPMPSWNAGGTHYGYDKGTGKCLNIPKLATGRV